MSSALTRLVRPAQIRRLSESQTKKHLIIATVGSIVSALAYKFLIIAPMRTAYDNHHK